MHYRYIPYVWLLIASALVPLALALYAFFCQRRAKGTKYCILCMLTAVVWALGNALEMAAADLPTKLFWANIQYFALCYSLLVLLAFSMEFTGFDHLLNSKNILGLAVIPTILFVLVWTNDWHQLIRFNVFLDHSGPFPVIAKNYGPAFYLLFFYSNLLSIGALFLLFRTVFYTRSVYRRQAIALLAGFSLIVIPNLMYVLGISPVTRFNLAPLFFAPAGLIFAWGIYRYKMLELIPLARAKVIETMQAGIVVVDIQGVVLDLNPASEEILGFKRGQIVGRELSEVSVNVPQLLRICSSSGSNQGEFLLTINGKAKVYEVIISPLTDKKKRLTGRLVSIHDITEKKQVEEEFLKQQKRLAVIEERDKLAKNMHDNLGQVLGFINLQVQGIKQELLKADIDLVSAKLDKLIEVSQFTHNEIREFIRNARDSASAARNFLAVLTTEIKNYEEQTGLTVELAVAKNLAFEEMEERIRFNLLYIIKEALNNIRKHAEARKAKIDFNLNYNGLNVIIEDDGNGFNPPESKNDTGIRFGLNIMKERAMAIGGQLEIQSAPGKGCRISLILPYGEGRQNDRSSTAG